MAFGELEIPVNTQNRDPRVACVLLVDVSGSMSGYVADLERGFKTFIDDIQGDPLARKRAEVAVVTFGSEANLLVPFQEARSLSPVSFQINGSTNMAAAINLALDELEARKSEYKTEGLKYYRPWLFLLTDGAPDRRPDAPGGDPFDAAVRRLNNAESRKQVTVFGVGVGEGVNWDQLNRLSNERVAVHMDGLAFGEMFRWLSASLSSVSKSANSGASDEDVASKTEQIALPSPQGWATVM